MRASLLILALVLPVMPTGAQDLPALDESAGTTAPAVASPPDRSGAAGAGVPASFVQTPNKLFATEVLANGVPVWLNVDTGAGTMLVPSLKRALGLQYQAGRSHVFAPYGKRAVRQSHVTLRVPGFVAKDHPCLVAEMEGVGPMKPDTTHGILGTDFLAAAGAVINFGDNTITFTAASHSVSVAPVDMLPCRIDLVAGLGPTTRLRINGRESIALIDTGCLETTALWDAALPTRVGVKTSPSGVEYTVVDRIDFVNEEVGTLSLAPYTVTLWRQERPGADEVPLARIPRVYLGLDLLRHLRAIIDYPAKTLYLAKCTPQT